MEQAVVQFSGGYQIPDTVKEIVRQASGAEEVSLKNRNCLYSAMGRIMKAAESGNKN